LSFDFEKGLICRKPQSTDEDYLKSGTIRLLLLIRRFGPGTKCFFTDAEDSNVFLILSQENYF
jgi:hypothetical protein